MAAPFLRKSVNCLISEKSLSLCKSNVPLLYLSTGVRKLCLDEPTISEFLTHKHHFSPESASRVASVLTRLKNLENAESVLSFLKETGFSNTELEKTVKGWPAVLSAKVEKTLKPKIRIFQDFGLTTNEIAEVVSKNPLLFNLGTNKLTSSLSVLKGVLGSKVQVAKFISASGLFIKNIEQTLVPNVELLKSCGVPEEQIIRVMNRPRFFSHKPETLRKFVEKADEMGFDRRSRMFVYAVRVVSSMTSETWELKLKVFREVGFSDDDILRVFRSAPLVFTKSEKKIRQVIEVLVGTGKYDMPCIINTPTVFLYSVERRHGPRMRVLSVLEKRGLIKKWPTLSTLQFMTDADFLKKFVAPRLDEVGEVWSAAISGKEEES